jgi:hypothetical protein
MTRFYRSLRSLTAITFFPALLVLSVIPATAGEYAALTGVKGLDSVFDISLGSPQMATVVFPAVLAVHQDQEVRALPAPPVPSLSFTARRPNWSPRIARGWKKRI